MERYHVVYTGVDIQDYLEHHGIKGMRWGVRRSPEELGYDVHKRRRQIKAVAKARKARIRKAKMAEKHEKRKNKIYDKVLNDPNVLRKYIKELDSNEIKDLTNKIDVANKYTTKPKITKLSGRKAKIAKSLDALQKHRNLFTDDEYKFAIDRLNEKQKAHEMKITELKRPGDYLEPVEHFLSKTANIAESVDKIVSKSIKWKNILDKHNGKKDDKDNNSGNKSKTSGNSSAAAKAVNAAEKTVTEIKKEIYNKANKKDTQYEKKQEKIDKIAEKEAQKLEKEQNESNDLINNYLKRSQYGTTKYNDISKVEVSKSVKKFMDRVSKSRLSELYPKKSDLESHDWASEYKKKEDRARQWKNYEATIKPDNIKRAESIINSTPRTTLSSILNNRSDYSYISNYIPQTNNFDYNDYIRKKNYYRNTFGHSDEEESMEFSDFNLDDFLEHHGIKGQRWGIQNGPPYPINDGAVFKTSNERKGNYKEYKELNKQPDGSYKNAASVIAHSKTNPYPRNYPGAAPKGELNKIDLKKCNFKSQSRIRQAGFIAGTIGKSLVDGILFSPVYTVLDLGKLSRTKYIRKPGQTDNCVKCGLALEVRKRGYDISAGRSQDGYTIDEYIDMFKPPTKIAKDVQKMYDPKTSNEDKQKLYEKLSKNRLGDDYFFGHCTNKEATHIQFDRDMNDMRQQFFAKCKPGDSGIISSSYGLGRGGHCIHWSKLKDGSVRFEDGQIGKSFNGYNKMMKFYKFISANSDILKLSDKEIDFEQMEKWNVIRECTNKDIKVSLNDVIVDKVPKEYKLHHSDIELDDFLMHYGIKGQKWGVRRSPEELGYRNNHHSKTDRGLPIKENSDVKKLNEIYNTLSKKEKKYLTVNGENKQYAKVKDFKNGEIVKSFISYNKDVPVAFFDVWKSSYKGDPNKNYYSIAIATKNDPLYRGKGYGKDIAIKALKQIEKSNMPGTYDWLVNQDNEASINLAKKLGFEYLGKSSTHDNWIFYTKEINDKVQHSDYLMHHGIKGQKWGIKNGPPYPLDGEQHKKRRKINNKYADDVTSMKKKRKTLEFNVDKWGTDKDHNILYITGLSGSGKSTLAWDYAKNKSDRNTDIIHLDLYYEKHNSPDEMSQQFNKLLDKKVPDWRHMSDPFNNKTRKQHWDIVDRFETALNEFGQEQYRKGRRVICEGVQLTDSGLYPNKKDLKGKPVIIMKTNFLKSSVSSAKRDSETMLDFISLITDASRLKSQKMWLKQQKTLINEISHSCLKHSDYLMHHGIKGQKWGIKNGPPYPINDSSNSFSKIRKSKDYNIDKWGKDKDNNVLYIAGMSGSGKSTKALQMADNKTDIIHLDHYFDKYVKGNNRNNNFNVYLNKNFPDWRKLSLPKNKISLKEWGKLLGPFEKAIEDFGRNQYKNGRKVIVEGVQLLDDTLYPDKSSLRNKPLMVMSTNALKSHLSASYRDTDNAKDFIKEAFNIKYLKWYKQGNEEVKNLIREMNKISIDELKNK